MDVSKPAILLVGGGEGMGPVEATVDGVAKVGSRAGRSRHAARPSSAAFCPFLGQAGRQAGRQLLENAWQGTGTARGTQSAPLLPCCCPVCMPLPQFHSVSVAAPAGCGEPPSTAQPEALTLPRPWLLGPLAPQYIGGDCQLVVICGRNAKLAEKLSSK